MRNALAVFCLTLAGCSGDRHHSEVGVQDDSAHSCLYLYVGGEGVLFLTSDSAVLNAAAENNVTSRITISSAQMVALMESLRRQGLSVEKGTSLQGKLQGIPPVSFKIVAKTPAWSNESIFWCQSGAEVPKKYRSALNSLRLDNTPDLFRRFMSLNSQFDG